MKVLATLRKWRIEAVWACVLGVVALWLMSVPVKADRWMYYDGAANWCFDMNPRNCLWQDP